MMKRLASLLFALAGAATAYAQIDFSNTSFAGITTGQSWTIYWADGNGESVSLSLVNATWSYPVFSEISESPMYYTWTVPAPPGFVTGNYMLQLSQDDGGDPAISPAFAITVAAPASSSTTSTASVSASTMASTTSGVPFIGPTVTSTVTVEYIFFDVGCGCTKSTSGAPTGTAAVASTTYTYYEVACGCTKSTVIPVSTLPANYTAPLTPPSPSVSTSTTPAPVASTFVGAAGKTEASFVGLVMMIAAAFIL